MRLMPILLAFFVAFCAAYGWCVEKRVNIAGPLALLIGSESLSAPSYSCVNPII
jgi:hypothetical protein